MSTTPSDTSLLEKYNARMLEAANLVRAYEPHLAECDTRARNAVIRAVIDGSYRYPVARFLDQLALPDGGEITVRMRGVGAAVRDHLIAHVIRNPLPPHPTPITDRIMRRCLDCGRLLMGRKGFDYCNNKCEHRHKARARFEKSPRAQLIIERVSLGESNRSIAREIRCSAARVQQIRARAVEFGLLPRRSNGEDE